MIVTKVEPLTKAKFKIEIDGQLGFVLYKGELSRYHIKEAEELPETTFTEIQEEVIVKRAKLRAMHLLTDMDRTESQLRTKLEQGLYTAAVIDKAVAYVKSFGYIDDEGYAMRFVQSKKDSKSKKEIFAGLSRKGMPKEVVEHALEEYYGSEDSKEAIQQLLKKKRYDPQAATEQEMHKIIGFLMRKGFNYGDIRQVIQVSEWNT